MVSLSYSMISLEFTLTLFRLRRHDDYTIVILCIQLYNIRLVIEILIQFFNSIRLFNHLKSTHIYTNHIRITMVNTI